MDGRTALLVLMDIEKTPAPTQEPGLQSLLACGAWQRRYMTFIVDRFATVRLALRVVVGRGLAPAAPPPNFAPPRTRRRTILGVHFLLRSACALVPHAFGVLLARAPRAGLQPYFARGTYQCRNSTPGCLLAPLGASAIISRARRFPIPLPHPGPLELLQRETLGVHSFDPAALSEAVAVDGRRLCLWPSRRRRPRLDCRWSSWRWPGTYDAPGLSRRGHEDGCKAVMSLCCGSISSSFRAPQESGLQSYELRRRRASLIVAEQLRGGLDALQRRRRPDACGSLLAVASGVRAIRSSARREGAEEGGLRAASHTQRLAPKT